MAVRRLSLACCQKLRFVSQQKSFKSSQYHGSSISYKHLLPNVCVNVHSRCYAAVQQSDTAVQPGTIEHPKVTSDSSTVSNEELDKFKELATEWWRPGGEFAALRSLNKLRVPLIKHLLYNKNNMHPSKPLTGLNILDVGCGGGILAEPLARLGANVVAIDPLVENIEAAKYRLVGNPELENLSYKCTTIEDVAVTHGSYFHLVVASEVLEHVDKPELFVSCCCDSIKPGGFLVVTTINRNILSTLLVKYAAEYLFRIVPEGTHNEEKFIQPDELTDVLRKKHMHHINFRGMVMNPLNYQWSWSDFQLMNYACHAQKPS